MANEENGAAPRKTYGLKYDWTKGFQLFCEDCSYNEIAAEIGCNPTSVRNAARRGRWHQKKAWMIERFAQTNADGPTQSIAVLAEELIHYLPNELSLLRDRQTQIEDARKLVVTAQDAVAIDRALDSIQERRRILLRVSMPATPRAPAQTPTKRARGYSSPGAICTDVKSSVVD